MRDVRSLCSWGAFSLVLHAFPISSGREREKRVQGEREGEESFSDCTQLWGGGMKEVLFGESWPLRKVPLSLQTGLITGCVCVCEEESSSPLSDAFYLSTVCTYTESQEKKPPPHSCSRTHNQQKSCSTAQKKKQARNFFLPNGFWSVNSGLLSRGGNS